MNRPLPPARRTALYMYAATFGGIALIWAIQDLTDSDASREIVALLLMPTAVSGFLAAFHTIRWMLQEPSA